MKHQILYSILNDNQLSEWKALIDSNIESLLLYLDQVLWWNKKVNLVSRDVSHETILEHIQHSLLLSVIDSFKESERIFDTGSGSGMPHPFIYMFSKKTIHCE